MTLNSTKSVAYSVWHTKEAQIFSGLKSCNVAGTDIQLSDKVKILEATLDSNLTMEPHTKALSSSCFYHIQSFKQIRSSLSKCIYDSFGTFLWFPELTNCDIQEIPLYNHIVGW